MRREVRPCTLVLVDGTVFEGEAIGAEPDDGISAGEVVFNTVLTGYQEVLTDPSYAGQIITYTYPHIGNYGVNDDDAESRSVFARGIVVRDLVRRHSNWRADGDLDGYLRDRGLSGIAGVDTRRLTRHIRDAGAMVGAFGDRPVDELLAAARAEPGTDGVDLVATVTTAEPYDVASNRGDGREPWRVVAVDYGIKTTILRNLAGIADVTVVGASTTAADILARDPDGVFLSNGPGDPAVVAGARDVIGALLGEVPVFGICLGHQLLSSALGAETYKLPFGHHGGNHPVRDVASGAVEITSQNHNFCVAEGTVESAEVTHLNLNDGTIEGIECRDVPAFGIQYHPEAGPGPHDSRYLFARFDDLIRRVKGGARASS